MISCWFSRHCFSLSSVRVSRCSRMETVCKTTGAQAQKVQGPLAAPGTPSACPAPPELRRPAVSSSHPGPCLALHLWRLWDSSCLHIHPGLWWWFSGVFGQGKTWRGEGGGRSHSPWSFPRQRRLGVPGPGALVFALEFWSRTTSTLVPGCPRTTTYHQPSSFQR